MKKTMNKNLLLFLIDLRFGNLNEKDEKISNEKTVFTKYVELFEEDMPPYPEMTFNEANKLITLIETENNRDNWSDIKKLIQTIDESFLSVMNDYCEEMKIKFNIDYFIKLCEKLYPFILQLKKKYNRPRPFQFANYCEIKLHPLESVTALNPSYPSATTILTYFIGKILEHQNPDKKEDIDELCSMIADSRMIMGVNYESDILFSRYIVDELVQLKDIKDIYFKEVKEEEKKEESNEDKKEKQEN